ncbi:MAG: hypothetical protein OXI95_00370, partial [bacterium]|nr:hypothetical protein [bacterium]
MLAGKAHAYRHGPALAMTGQALQGEGRRQGEADPENDVDDGAGAPGQSLLDFSCSGTDEIEQ